MFVPFIKNPYIRFHSKIIKTDSCWIWDAAKNNKGYGLFQENNNRWLAHRYSYTIHNGEIPQGMFVCHECDNPPCVNPKHLWLGDNSTNMKDAYKKGRLNSNRNPYGRNQFSK